MGALQLGTGELDLLAGCPPCQGFSALRTRNGARPNRDSRNALIDQMLRFATVLRPKTVMMENVPHLERHISFRRLCAGLEQLGYEVSWDVKDLAGYGVPQRRKRLILLAGKGFKIPFPAESTLLTTVRSTIGKLPQAGSSGDALHDLPERRSAKIMQLIRDIPKNGGSRGDLPKGRQLPCHRDFDGFRDVYGRMAWDNVAPTITGGCFNPSKGRFIHPIEDRAITMREAALLQTFPLNYKFPNPKNKEAIALMIGNALPPEFIRRQAEVILESLRAT